MGKPTKALITCAFEVTVCNLCTGWLRHFILPHLRSSMPPQRQHCRLTTVELTRATGMLEYRTSQCRVHVMASRRMAQLPSAMLWSTTTMPREDRFLVVQARRHPFLNATTLRNELRNDVGVNISTQTVRNRLQQSGLRSRRACIRIPLTRLHQQARLDWT